MTEIGRWRPGRDPGARRPRIERSEIAKGRSLSPKGSAGGRWQPTGAYSLAVASACQRAQRWQAAELARLEKAIATHLAAQPALAADIARLTAIPGIGTKTAEEEEGNSGGRWVGEHRLLAVELPRHCKNARAVAAWLCLVPRQSQSGTSVHKASRIGHAAPALRDKLYFPALTAMRHDPRSIVFAQRLRSAGKTPMQILFAVLHKLVHNAFALLKSSAAYNPNHALLQTT